MLRKAPVGNSIAYAEISDYIGMMCATMILMIQTL